MQKILIATSNQGKFVEISALLDEIGIKSSKIEQKITQPEENGVSFEQNALIKARYYGDYFKQIALADDSGLTIPDLDGAPGVDTAPFSVNPATNQRDFPFAFEKLAKMLQQKGVDPLKERVDAYFTCNLCLFNPFNKQFFHFEGRVDGFLTYPPKGEKGFGFDPIFTMENMDQTFGQIDRFKKDAISHRGRAFAKLTAFLKENGQLFGSF